MQKVLSLFEKLLNINRGEWSRVSLSWFINLFYRVGFVIGWTIIVGMFVGMYGIFMLPVLFIVNGIFTIIGTLIYSTFIDRVPKEKIILYTILFACLFLGFAAFVGKENAVLFFALLLASEAVFLVQLKIVTNGFVETLFTPLESERSFPVIESSETVGGIIAGSVVVFLSGGMSSSYFVYVWIAALLLIIPCLAYYKYFLKGVYRFELGGDDNGHHFGFIDKMKEVGSQIRHVAFIKGLFLVVMFQWIFASLIEFQYTRAVSENVAEIALTSGSGFEHALVHDLGALFVLFSVLALVVQLFAGSRLITSLGIVGSMMLYPIVMLFSVFGLAVRFGYPTAVMAQASKNITHVLHMNAYHSAYYSVKEHFREHTREFLEGVVRPVGAVIGTLLLLGLQRLFIGEDLVLSVNLVMVFVLVALFLVTYGLQSKYTKVACNNLVRTEDKFDKIEAIDILSQRGHKSALPTLKKVLHDPKESDYVKARILHAFGELREYDALDEVLAAFNSKKVELRMAAIESLLKFHTVKTVLFKSVFHEYKMIEALKELYKTERNDEIRSLVIHLLSKLNPVGTFGFLLNILKRSRSGLKADVILALGNYKDEQVIDCIKPYLHSRNPGEKASSIIALWKFPEFRDDLDLELDKMLSSKKNSYKRAAVYAVGELKLRSKKRKCCTFLKAQDVNLRVKAAVALANMGDLSSVDTIVDILFEDPGKISHEVKRQLRKTPHKVKSLIEKKIKQLVAGKINELLVKTKAKSLKHLDTKSLKYLKILYSLVDENEEVELISELLYTRRYS
jgi:HEAT repeat protein/ATP/ADP translocase